MVFIFLRPAKYGHRVSVTRTGSDWLRRLKTWADLSTSVRRSCNLAALLPISISKIDGVSELVVADPARQIGNASAISSHAPQIVPAAVALAFVEDMRA